MDQNQKPETLLDDVSQANNTTTTTPPVTPGVPVSPAPVSAPQTEPESLDLHRHHKRRHQFQNLLLLNQYLSMLLHQWTIIHQIIQN